MNRRKRHLVGVGLVSPCVEVRQERDIREERLKPVPARVLFVLVVAIVPASDLRREFLDVVETIGRFLFLPFKMKVVFVEEVDEILDELAYLVVLEMALRKRKALRKRRPKRLRLCAEHPAERVAVLAALRVERPGELLPVLAGARLAYAG